MLRAEQISFERYFQPVFHPLDVDLGNSELLLVTGPNGCGKTTLIRLLAGILTPTSGTIHRAADALAYVGHQLGIKDDLSVRENLRFASAFHGSGNADPEEVVRRMGLHRVRNQLARSLSAGQRKRCALSRLLLSPAQLWLLDEPYSNLDDQGVSLVDEMLDTHLGAGGACVLATHGQHRPEVAGMRHCLLRSGAAG